MHNDINHFSGLPEAITHPLGTAVRAGLVVTDVTELKDALRRASAGEPFEFQHDVLCTNGQRLVVLHRGVLNPAAEPGQPTLGVAILRDITAQRQAEQRVLELGNFDEITGLPKRADLLQPLHTALQAAAGAEHAVQSAAQSAAHARALRALQLEAALRHALQRAERCSFISDVTAAPESASMARSIINLAHGLQIPVIAEGVETEGQLNMLAANDCDRIRGFLFSRPVSADEMATLLRSGRRLVSHLAERPARSRTLLLVDDEPSVLSALRRLFRRDGYRLLTAASGAEALALLAVNGVDVILSDQRMPGMTGVDFLRRAKALYPGTVRMTLSGFTDLQSIIDAVNEGAVYKFLTKPWDDERLRAHVAQAFTQKEMADDNHRLQRELAAANADMALLNQRLEQLLARQSEQSERIQAGAGSVRDLVDVLPAAVFALDPDGMLAFLNPAAAALMPSALACLGGEPSPQLGQLLASVRAAAAGAPGQGLPVSVNQQACQAWIKPMPSTSVDRGEVLVLLPMAAADTHVVGHE